MKNKSWIFGLLIICHSIFARWPFNFFATKKPFTLILEATGDALTPGRTIFSNFENTVSFTIAHQIKQVLDGNQAPAKIYINRTPTEIITPLQNAQFANKLTADLYISIHCYQNSQNQTRINLYRYSHKDPIILKKGALGFHTFDNAYLVNESQTNNWIHELKKIISEQNQIEIHGPFALPFKPLTGIEASAIGIEIGITPHTNIPEMVRIIVDALEQLIIRSNT